MKEIEWRRICELKRQLCGDENPSVFPEEILGLYGPWSQKTVFLNDFSSESGSAGVNKNQVEAEARILHIIAGAERGGQAAVILLQGPMSSGKTTVGGLLQEDLRKTGKKFAVYRHSLDRQRFFREMESHGGRKLAARDYTNLEDIDIDGLDIIFVDEIQFAGENRQSLAAFLKKCARNETHVILSGLDMDFRREAWPITELLMAEADRIIVLRAKCAHCGQPAEFTQRLVKGQPAKVNDPLIVIDGVAHDAYQARCGCCHKVSGKNPTRYF